MPEAAPIASATEPSLRHHRAQYAKDVLVAAARPVRLKAEVRAV
jgi:hypothetical protein